eukprot:CAMPEP_0114230716 /NCGR_PEP_ID=MMETSP0058-20121206/3625_1 /TAXON_ID=36894 /ORGANISM="Pyramimonas parkeae, CCMP726" /LENGTH=405 /DNA_ID=CAMNT_0001341949 /DNA_START=148 /DNA_END=1366 /DNA_ORIENTATION=-
MIQVLFQFAHNGYAIPEEEWELRAVGSVPELGSWDPRCAPSLKVDNVKGCSSAILWLPQGKTVEYRMVLVSKHSQQDGVSTVLWEGKGKHTPYTRRINRRYQPSIKLQASMFKPRSRSSPLTTKVAFVVRKKLWSGTKLYLALNVRNSESHQAPLEMTWKRGDVWSVDADIAIGETVDMTLMLRNDARVVEWEPAVCRSLRVERDSDAALAERYRRRKHLRRTDKVHLVWGEGGQVLPMARREGRRALLVAKAPPLQPEAASTAPVQVQKRGTLETMMLRDLPEYFEHYLGINAQGAHLGEKVQTEAGSFLVDMWTEGPECVLVCECDEDDHRTYSLRAESRRMLLLSAALEARADKPVVFLRLGVRATKGKKDEIKEIVLKRKWEAARKDMQIAKTLLRWDISE